MELFELLPNLRSVLSKYKPQTPDREEKAMIAAKTAALQELQHDFISISNSSFQLGKWCGN